MSTELNIPNYVRFAWEYLGDEVWREGVMANIAYLRATEPQTPETQRLIANLEESKLDNPYDLLMPDPFIINDQGTAYRARMCQWIDPTGQWVNVRKGPMLLDEMEEISADDDDSIDCSQEEELYVGRMRCFLVKNIGYVPSALVDKRSSFLRLRLPSYLIKHVPIYKRISYKQSLEQAKKVFGMVSRLVGCTPFDTQLQPAGPHGFSTNILQEHGMVTAVLITKDHSVVILQENRFLLTVGLLGYPKHIKGGLRVYGTGIHRHSIGLIKHSIVKTKKGKTLFILKSDQDPKNLRKKKVRAYDKTKASSKRKVSRKRKNLRIQDLMQSKATQYVSIRDIKILKSFARCLPMARFALEPKGSSH